MKEIELRIIRAKIQKRVSGLIEACSEIIESDLLKDDLTKERVDTGNSHSGIYEREAIMFDDLEINRTFRTPSGEYEVNYGNKSVFEARGLSNDDKIEGRHSQRAIIVNLKGKRFKICSYKTGEWENRLYEIHRDLGKEVPEEEVSEFRRKFII